jgi:signal transduction histidine kinase
MEALGQLTGGVAHDFNNIMMIVSGYAQYLKGDQKDPKRARALQAIQTAISRGENLTRQLLSFSRYQPLHPIVLHPSDAVEAQRLVPLALLGFLAAQGVKEARRAVDGPDRAMDDV